MASHHQVNGSNKSQVVVVMVPFPVHSHLHQLLHLSRLISAYNIPIHFLSTATHIRQAKSRTQLWNLDDPTIFQFHELPTPPFQSPPPNPNSSLKFPTHLQPLMDASINLRGPVGTILRDISSTAQKIVLIHDTLISPVVQDVATISNAESYSLQSVSAFDYVTAIWEAMGKPSLVEDKSFKYLPPTEGCVSEEFLEKYIAAIEISSKFDSGTVHNSSKVVEGKYIDQLKEFNRNIKHFALGPFNPVSVSNELTSDKRNKCLVWLDKQAPNSVIFVSFGTTISLPDEQIHELALGLEKSEQKFIWVLRDADKADIYAKGENRRFELPEGYEQRVSEQGMIVRDWAPQLEILAHTSTGGFMSHCGWNSCMESFTMGVPIAGWPMHSDQPRNAALIADILKLGVHVRDWEKRDELVSSVLIEKAVRKLLDSEEGDEMRKRAEELGEKIKGSVEEGGVTRAEMDSFISHITTI